jgi:hypothetical protein
MKTDKKKMNFEPHEISAIAHALTNNDGLSGLEAAVESVCPGRTYDDMTLRDCQHLDALAFCCEQCDYWHGEAEKARTTDSGWVCAGCES